MTKINNRHVEKYFNSMVDKVKLPNYHFAASFESLIRHVVSYSSLRKLLVGPELFHQVYQLQLTVQVNQKCSGTRNKLKIINLSYLKLIFRLRIRNQMYDLGSTGFFYSEYYVCNIYKVIIRFLKQEHYRYIKSNCAKYFSCLSPRQIN